MLPIYPPQLPISALKNRIVDAIREHQVIVIAGDTGSGKTTQIPKMCLEAGLGTTGMIGCTQPRRIAAVSMAERVAVELNDSEHVGYKIRFRDRTDKTTLIKFMTDGVLLSETRQDRQLLRYDTLIIDEAHERSLNIDFLLGYLHQLLRKRPDLKLIIASATIDTEKFSAHFHNAPIIRVSGRTFPIAMEYRPPAEAEANDGESYVDQAALETVRLADETRSGDILVFMPTERDIRDCVEILRKKLPGQALVLPLFGRLQAADQRKIFQPVRLRKIIVATNVAETSITVPGIRYVVDTGLARLARYNVRAGTTSLQIGKISQASCEQRSGRCGRTGPGRCIRLYSEEDYLSRPPFTQPEIQRSNLAQVILQMISLRLGAPRDFPFIDPPARRSITDGYRTLNELCAITPKNRLTAKGKIMARLPLDPAISRVIIAGKEMSALRELTIIAAGLSIRDPRIRPADREEQADEIHRRFRTSNSDFLSLLKIWDTFHATAGRVHSQAKLKKFCKNHFLSWQRMREWLDIHEQINRLARHEKGFRENVLPASYEAVHQALLTGFLRNIGCKKRKNIYQISGGRESTIFPGSVAYNHAGQWIMAASFMETSRLFALNAATIDVRWLESIGAELCRRSWSAPHWEKKSGQVVALEKVTLFGLIIVASRRVNYGRINSVTSRESRDIFIRSALIEGELGGNFNFFQQNLEQLERFREMEERTRRRGIVFDEETLYAFYAERLGPVYDRFTLKLFLKTQTNDHLLRMTEADICRALPDGNELYRFPKTLQSEATELRLSYSFEPGHPDDGVSVDIPRPLAAGLNPTIFEWLVPGLLQEKILALLKSLPKKLRRRMVPLPDTVDRIIDDLHIDQGSLYPALEKSLLKHFRITIRRGDWQADGLPIHLKMRFRLIGDDNALLYNGRSYRDLLAHCTNAPARTSTSRKPFTPTVRTGLTSCDWTTSPEPIPITNEDNCVTGFFFPSLKIDEASQSLELHYIDDKEKSIAFNRSGLRFLYTLQFRQEIKALSRECKTALAGQSASWLSLGLSMRGAEIRERLRNFILDDIFEIRNRELPTGQDFDHIAAASQKKGIVREGRKRLEHILRLLQQRRTLVSQLCALHDRMKNNDDIQASRLIEYREHLDQLLPSSFLTALTYRDLLHTERYLRALIIRIERAEHDPAKDAAKAKRLKTAVNRLRSIPDEHSSSADCCQSLSKYRQMLEEFRVSIFAPEVGTAMPVSEKRLQIQWEEVENHCRSVEG